ncbi:hypothetical protein [uncultured Brevundimonas sp.]|uniref:hypothetical protein n=1 Tax=uncultured Brevundimonas sp. TaxID=213418 RepID=UPI0025DBA7B9|nr:hypothetical protein [uncultured Brevundimonas sp.]
MPVLALPSTPAPSSMGVQLLTNKNVLVSALGGDEQERQRKGSRYALTFQLPPMRYVTAMAWDDLNAEGVTVLMRVYQPGFDTGAPGTPLVKGAGQAGTTLIVDGLTNGYVIRKGQFLNVVTNGRRYLYRAASDVTVAGGQASIPLRTMLRHPPADNDVVEIAQPMIEGFVRELSEQVVGVDRMTQFSFTVRERG